MQIRKGIDSLKENLGSSTCSALFVKKSKNLYCSFTDDIAGSYARKYFQRKKNR